MDEVVRNLSLDQPLGRCILLHLSPTDDLRVGRDTLISGPACNAFHVADHGSAEDRFCMEGRVRTRSVSANHDRHLAIAYGGLGWRGSSRVPIRRQVALLPESLDGYVDADNPVRVADAYCDALDLTERGFDGIAPEATGHPAIIRGVARGGLFREGGSNASPQPFGGIATQLRCRPGPMRLRL